MKGGYPSDNETVSEQKLRTQAVYLQNQDIKNMVFSKEVANGKVKEDESGLLDETNIRE